MASLVSTGSPRSSRKTTPIVNVLDHNDDNHGTPTHELKVPKATKPFRGTPSPLQTSMLGNRQPTKGNNKNQSVEGTETSTGLSSMEDILARLRLNDGRKSSPPSAQAPRSNANPHALDKFLTHLEGKNKALKGEEKDLKDDTESNGRKDEDHSSGSDLHTPATDSFDIISSEGSRESDTVRIDAAEMLRLKQELAAAKSVISRQEQDLAETRNLKHTMDQAMGPPSEVDFGNHDVSEQTIGNLQTAFNASARPFTSRTDTWNGPEMTRIDNTNTFSNVKGRAIWNNHAQASYAPGLTINTGHVPIYGNPSDAHLASPAFSMSLSSPVSPIDPSFAQASRTFSGSSTGSFGYDGRVGIEQFPQTQPVAIRRNMNNIRSSTFSERSMPYGSLGTTGLAQGPMSPVGAPPPYAYQPRPMGPPLSPTGSDFAASLQSQSGAPWSSVPAVSGQTYVTPLEPMNYRRLLDKSVSCDWKYIVDKIVCSNDQQASIFLQQKLKVGTAEQKFEIVESIVNQAYPLMINRFGNFLVQRCFEHGTPEQVIAIASAIHGNVLSLSMDPFGCHVIQKAFDSVPENHKADMVRELLRRIPDTVIHRYACHVWQKLFELRWSGEPPQIMLKVNDALLGMWHEVALGETGSLVVQNIFENCVEEEKRPAIEEVIANIDLIAHGQFGNWCIQHLCEHGSPPDKRRVIDHILVNSYSYSIDQFASKVVEKCLKIGGVEFLDRYLGVITTAHPDRPRIPLIDIAGDQYGNYLIQWILMNTHHHQREQVAIHIRKHMVSLRGSKFGSRVAMLCCNPAQQTRPGAGALVNPYGAPGQPRGWARFR